MTNSHKNSNIPTELNNPELGQFIAWTTLAYRQTEKPLSWYLLMGVVVVLFVLYGFFSTDPYGWVVSITFLIMAGVYYLSELKRAPAVRIIVSERGIRFGGRFFPYNDIKSFWILNLGDEHKLHISLYKGTQREIDMMIAADINLTRLRSLLLLHLAEEEGKKESFSDQIIRNLGM
ncbi:MAG: hypothetical protein U1C97_00475 [Candidatus Gracilibacteria bacterium]|nr:hypothetical protein [bacterium]MDZ4216776.1 hypothetical protein [Candidatus Gracilibacteria bacterium]